eukprot:5310112-Pyramimonas_sp.AAC.1
MPWPSPSTGRCSIKCTADMVPTKIKEKADVEKATLDTLQAEINKAIEDSQISKNGYTKINDNKKHIMESANKMVERLDVIIGSDEEDEPELQ